MPAKFHNSALVSFEWNIFWAEALCDWNLLSMKNFESRASSENTLRHIFGSRTWGERMRWCKFSFIWICRDDQSISKHRTKVCDIYCEMKKPLCHGDETRIIFWENRIVNYVVWISRVFDGEGSSIASATAYSDVNSNGMCRYDVAAFLASKVSSTKCYINFVPCLELTCCGVFGKW